MENEKKKDTENKEMKENEEIKENKEMPENKDMAENKEIPEKKKKSEKWVFAGKILLAGGVLAALIAGSEILFREPETETPAEQTTETGAELASDAAADQTTEAKNDQTTEGKADQAADADYRLKLDEMMAAGQYEDMIEQTVELIKNKTATRAELRKYTEFQSLSIWKDGLLESMEWYRKDDQNMKTYQGEYLGMVLKNLVYMKKTMTDYTTDETVLENEKYLEEYYLNMQKEVFDAISYLDEEAVEKGMLLMQEENGQEDFVNLGKSIYESKNTETN